MSFKSSVDGASYKHIVLALKHNGKWGSVGLSRRRELYFKELQFDSLADLFLEFKRSYERVFHTLKHVRVGLPISHDVYAGEHVCWNYLTARCADVAAATKLLEEHGRVAHRLQEGWRQDCKWRQEHGQKLPPPPKKGAEVEDSEEEEGEEDGADAADAADGDESKADGRVNMHKV